MMFHKLLFSAKKCQNNVYQQQLEGPVADTRKGKRSRKQMTHFSLFRKKSPDNEMI